jgi:steroid delta-isomerase-like uncharacterized protein
MDVTDAKRLARDFFGAFDRRAFAEIEQLLAPGAVSHLPGAPQPLDFAAHQQYAAPFVAAFPDSFHVIEDQLADSDNVVTRMTFRGRHTGEFMGIPPTDREIAIEALSWFRLADGRIGEEWTQMDRIGLMVQLGVVPAPPPGKPLSEGVPDAPEQLNKLSDLAGVVARWIARVDQGGVPDVGQYVAHDYRDHNPPPFPGLGEGIVGVRQSFPYALNAFSDFHHEIDAQLTEGDRVASRVTGYGTHVGDFLGVPGTGKEVSMSGISIHRVVDGKLVEHWAQVDAFSLLQQMGAIPS